MKLVIRQTNGLSENMKVTFRKSLAKDLQAIPNQDAKRILSRIDTLADNPKCEGCIKLVKSVIESGRGYIASSMKYAMTGLSFKL